MLAESWVGMALLSFWSLYVLCILSGLGLLMYVIFRSNKLD